MSYRKSILTILLGLALGVSARAQPSPSSVFYGASHVLYKHINLAFTACQGHETVSVNQSHGSASKHALAVADSALFNQFAVNR